MIMSLFFWPKFPVSFWPPESVFWQSLFWVSEERISNYWNSYSLVTVDLATSLRGVKTQICNFVLNFLISSSVLWQLFVFQGNVKFALDFISICGIWGNKNASIFFQYMYVFGIKTKLDNYGWEWCCVNIAFTGL